MVWSREDKSILYCNRCKRVKDLLDKEKLAHLTSCRGSDSQSMSKSSLEMEGHPVLDCYVVPGQACRMVHFSFIDSKSGASRRAPVELAGNFARSQEWDHIPMERDKSNYKWVKYILLPPERFSYKFCLPDAAGGKGGSLWELDPSSDKTEISKEGFRNNFIDLQGSLYDTKIINAHSWWKCPFPSCSPDVMALEAARLFLSGKSCDKSMLEELIRKGNRSSLTVTQNILDLIPVTKDGRLQDYHVEFAPPFALADLAAQAHVEFDRKVHIIAESDFASELRKSPKHAVVFSEPNLQLFYVLQLGSCSTTGHEDPCFLLFQRFDDVYRHLRSQYFQDQGQKMSILFGVRSRQTLLPPPQNASTAERAQLASSSSSAVASTSSTDPKRPSASSVVFGKSYASVAAADRTAPSSSSTVSWTPNQAAPRQDVPSVPQRLAAAPELKDSAAEETLRKVALLLRIEKAGSPSARLQAPTLVDLKQGVERLIADRKGRLVQLEEQRRDLWKQHEEVHVKLANLRQREQAREAEKFCVRRELSYMHGSREAQERQAPQGASDEKTRQSREAQDRQAMQRARAEQHEEERLAGVPQDCDVQHQAKLNATEGVGGRDGSVPTDQSPVCPAEASRTREAEGREIERLLDSWLERCGDFLGTERELVLSLERCETFLKSEGDEGRKQHLQRDLLLLKGLLEALHERMGEDIGPVQLDADMQAAVLGDCNAQREADLKQNDTDGRGGGDPPARTKHRPDQSSSQPLEDCLVQHQAKRNVVPGPERPTATEQRSLVTEGQVRSPARQAEVDRAREAEGLLLLQLLEEYGAGTEAELRARCKWCKESYREERDEQQRQQLKEDARMYERLQLRLVDVRSEQSKREMQAAVPADSPPQREAALQLREGDGRAGRAGPAPGEQGSSTRVVEEKRTQPLDEKIRGRLKTYKALQRILNATQHSLVTEVDKEQRQLLREDVAKYSALLKKLGREIVAVEEMEEDRRRQLQAALKLKEPEGLGCPHSSMPTNTHRDTVPPATAGEPPSTSVYTHVPSTCACEIPVGISPCGPADPSSCDPLAPNYRIPFPSPGTTSDSSRRSSEDSLTEPMDTS